MARQIVDIDGLTQVLPLTRAQIYHKVRDAKNPIPHKKHGRTLMFDLDRVYRWFDDLPGADRTPS